MTDLSPEPGNKGAALESRENRRIYWLRARRVTAALLLTWFVAGLAIHFFARELSFRFFGWPFSFWMAAQGSLLIFLPGSWKSSIESMASIRTRRDV
jgi:putative solute:sodium symporter small subunit